MKTPRRLIHLFASAALAGFVLSPAAGAQVAARIIRFFFAPLSAGLSADFGDAVVRMNDLNGDGKSEVAIAASLSDTGGVDAGEVFVFDVAAATPTPIWSLTGTATLDKLGTAVCRIADMTGDGKDDLAVGAPGNGPGSVFLVNGANGSVFASLPPVGSGGHGSAIVTLDADVDGDQRDEIVVLENNNVEVYLTGQIAAGSPVPIQIPKAPLETVLASAGDFFNDGTSFEIALGSPTAIPTSVRVLDVLVRTSKTFLGTPGDGLGNALIEWKSNPPSVIAAAPGPATIGSGELRQLSLSGNVRFALSAAGSLGSGMTSGDIDRDGLPDVLVGCVPSTAPGAVDCQVFMSDGTLQVSGSFGAPAFSSDPHIAIIDDLNGDGFPEFVVATGLTAEVVLGGPTATSDNNFARGCSTTNLVLSSGFPGGSVGLILSNPSVVSGLVLMGPPNAAGNVVSGIPCPLFMDSPLTMAFYTTAVVVPGLTAAAVSVPIQNNFALLGLRLVFQGLDLSTNPATFTNAGLVRIGW